MVAPVSRPAVAAASGTRLSAPCPLTRPAAPSFRVLGAMVGDRRSSRLVITARLQPGQKARQKNVGFSPCGMLSNAYSLGFPFSSTGLGFNFRTVTKSAGACFAFNSVPFLSKIIVPLHRPWHGRYVSERKRCPAIHLDLKRCSGRIVRLRALLHVGHMRSLRMPARQGSIAKRRAQPVRTSAPAARSSPRM